MDNQRIESELSQIAKLLLTAKVKATSVTIKNGYFDIALSSGRKIKVDTFAGYEVMAVYSYDLKRFISEDIFIGDDLSHITQSDDPKKRAKDVAVWLKKDMDYEDIDDEIEEVLNEPAGVSVYLKVLTNVFTTRVGKRDLRHIRYRTTPRSIVMEDYDSMLGGMYINEKDKDIESLFKQHGGDGLGLKDLAKFLEENGARKIKNKRVPKSFPLYD